MIRDERGFTLVEMLVGMMTSLIVLGAILMLVQVAVKNQSQTAERVAAEQRGRPAMNKILDRLHAACVAPLMTPVREGSDDDTLILLSKAGSAAVVTPDRYVIGISGTGLSESVYAPTGGKRRNGRLRRHRNRQHRSSTGWVPLLSANRRKPCRSSAITPMKTRTKTG